MPDTRIRVELFEDIWDIVLKAPGIADSLPPDLLDKLNATPRDIQFARARREIPCTVREAQALLRAFTAAASAYALTADTQRLRLAGEGSRHIVDALRKAVRP